MKFEKCSTDFKCERVARFDPPLKGRGQVSYLSGCGKELASDDRSGESPSFEEGVLQIKRPVSKGGVFFRLDKIGVFDGSGKRAEVRKTTQSF